MNSSSTPPPDLDALLAEAAAHEQKYGDMEDHAAFCLSCRLAAALRQERAAKRNLESRFRFVPGCSDSECCHYEFSTKCRPKDPAHV